MALYKLRASFTASALDYGADSVDNSLKAEGLSQTSSAVVTQNSSLALDGALASAASSGFASPHRITITSTGDDSSGAIFVITGTDANSGAQTVEIQGGAAGKTVTTAESFKTVSSITVKNGSADTAGTVSAGIASILEGDTGNNQKATYTITATDFPSNTTLTLNLSSTAQAFFNYDTANESTSRDFTDSDEGTPITVTVLAAQDSTDELFDQTKDFLENKKINSKNFTKPIAFNLIPHIDSFVKDGYTKEEMKMTNETKKILDSEIDVTATCVRVPVRTGHSESINIEFDNLYDFENINRILSNAPGCKVIDERKDGGYITPLEAEGDYTTYISRIRKDNSNVKAINIWVVSDNLLKGAALNTVQIAEHLVKKL